MSEENETLRSKRKQKHFKFKEKKFLHRFDTTRYRSFMGALTTTLGLLAQLILLKIGSFTILQYQYSRGPLSKERSCGQMRGMFE